MGLADLLREAAAEVEALQAQVVQLTSEKEALQMQVDAQPAALQASYDSGFAAGVASVPTGGESDKLYSQVELDAAIALAKQQVKDSALALMDAQQSSESASEADLRAGLQNL